MLDRFLRSHHVFPADSALALEVRALRQGDPPAAARHFQEVCAPAPRKAHTGCCTSIDDEGWGIFCAQRDFGGLANHRASAKQAAASLRGGIYGYETWAPRGRWSDTSSADTIGRMPTGSLIAPADLAAAADLAQELGALRELPLAPYATRTESTANYRRPNAIHGNGSPSLPQNAIFADWAHWRDHGRLNADLEEAIDLLALVQTPPAGGAWADKAQTPGLVVLDLYDTDGNRDNAFSFALAGKFTDAASVYGYRAPSGADALITASLASGSLTVSVPEGSTADGMTAVTVVGYDRDKLPVAWTVVVHVVAVEGYTVEEQAWGETSWDAPEDAGADWALLWQCNKYRWLPQTTSGGLVTAANWSFASVAVDSSRQRWAYGTPTSTGEFLVNPSVTFGGSTIYFDSINTASVGLKRTAEPSAEQPRIAATYVKSMEWEEVAWSREVKIDDYKTSTGMAKLTNGEDGYIVYPHYKHHPEIQQPMDHTTVRVEVELAAPVPEGMLGSVHLAWYDPNNTVANLPASPPTKAATARATTTRTSCSPQPARPCLASH